MVKIFSFMVPYCKKDIEVLENVQRRTMESGAQEQLTVLGMLSLKKRGDLITLQAPERRLEPGGGSSLLPSSNRQEKRKWTQVGS